MTDRIPTRATLRRAFERHAAFPALVLVAAAIVSIGAMARGHIVIGGIGLVVPAIATAVVLARAPSRRLRRLVRAATGLVRDEDGGVTLIGTVTPARGLLRAPYSQRPCAAYWARTLDDSEGARATMDERMAVRDFVLTCDGGTAVVIDTSSADLVFDERSAECIGDDHQEIVASSGARVVVRGHLVRGPVGGPHRDHLRIESRDRRIVVGIGIEVPAPRA